MEVMTRKLFFDPSGPYVSYEYARGGVLHIEDLNPQIKTKWVMSRWELFQFGWRAIWAAVRGTHAR